MFNHKVSKQYKYFCLSYGWEGAYPATTVIEVEMAPDPYLLFARTMKVKKKVVMKKYDQK
jgi:hypothetical protein